MFLPRSFDIDQLLALLKSRRGSFNIRARQASGSLYVLDLAKCYDFLSTIKAGSETRENEKDLRAFIDDTLAKRQKWFKCVRECDPGKNKTVRHVSFLTKVLNYWAHHTARRITNILQRSSCSRNGTTCPPGPPIHVFPYIKLAPILPAP